MQEIVVRYGKEHFYDSNNEKTKRMKMMNMGRTTSGGKHHLDIPDIFKHIAVKVHFPKHEVLQILVVAIILYRTIGAGERSCFRNLPSVTDHRA